MAPAAADRVGSAMRSVHLPSAGDRGPGTGEGGFEAELFVVGVGLAIAGLAVALAVVSAGSLRGRLVRGARHDAAAPSPGSIPGERHRQTRAAAAR